MSSKIVPLIPKHTVYVEPFAGGASVFFAKPWPQVSNSDHYREYLNDKDQRLVNFYRVLQTPEKRKQLIERLQLTLFAESEHQKAKDLLSGTDIDQAWAYYVNSQQSFSNTLNGGWRRSVYGRNQQATWKNKIDGLSEYLERMGSVGITCQDAIKVIKQLDSPQTFFYCDPPYPGSHQGHYSGYTRDHFQELVTALDKCNGSFLLSNYDQPDIAIPSDWERFEFNAYASSKRRVGYDRSQKMDESSQNRKRTEAVWRRFNKVPVREEIQKLYDSGKFDCFVSQDKIAG